MDIQRSVMFILGALDAFLLGLVQKISRTRKLIVKTKTARLAEIIC